MGGLLYVLAGVNFGIALSEATTPVAVPLTIRVPLAVVTLAVMAMRYYRARRPIYA